MNNICISLSIKENINANCFCTSRAKVFTDISNLGAINLKFGYVLLVTFVSTKHITLRFTNQSCMSIDCSFLLPYEVEKTFNLPIEGGMYCVTLSCVKSVCGAQCCGESSGDSI
ncbi:MAG: hypothetical protein RR922_04290 [Clostridia bacterium]